MSPSALMPYALAMTRDTAAAEELLQETLSRLSPQPQPVTRCLALMRHLFFNTSIRLAPDLAPPTQPIDLCVTSVPPEQVMRAVNRLPEHFREILVLVAMLDQRFDWAAQVCGCSEATVRRRVSRARELLLANLAD